ncbi:hypothetical protein LSTR_LSTR008494 [Laodelphax striatellus]|uniref:Nucleoporin Nup37 n=1 Tax=Laodelphax striatellus TaxID=195883 RepID=A0A482WQW7_LAOST|nr:hypothetical protein LSTR_LSTR008494 [Laodelphax striatellus]
MPSKIVDNIHLNVKVNNPTHVMELPEQVVKVELSPFEWSHNLICIALPKLISVRVIKFQEEDEELEEEVDLELLQDFTINCRVDALAWSPETSLNVLPKCIMFCAATKDFNLRLFSSNTVDAYSEQVLTGHTDYINSIAFESNGEYLASASDDLSCRLWAMKDGQKCVAEFALKSPGMSVCWHSEEPGKLLVGEKNGTVRIYNVERQQAILSFETFQTPLLAADWSPANSLLVAAIAGGSLFVWNITRPNVPLDRQILHSKGWLLRCSHQSDQHFATIGQPANTLKVVHTSVKQPIANAALKCVGGLSWHRKLPYVCVGVDRSICLWKIATN